MKRLSICVALFFACLTICAQESELIRRNQVGCYPQQEKVIVVEGKNPGNKVRVTMPDGKTIKAKTVRKAVSPLSQKTRYVVTLDGLTTPGDYRVSLGDESCVLHVSNRPYRDIAKASLRLFYLIRSGVAIDDAVYSRPLGHPDTRVQVHNSAASLLRPAGTVINSPYGWYDAGDYNKYVVNSAFSIGLMFAAYEQLPYYFAQLKTDIPESNNVTPDILDEMMFNLKWFLTMQDPYDGGVYHKLTTPNFEGFVMPTDCKQQRYVVAKSTTATLDFASVMADAARLFEPYQRDYPGFSAQAAAMAERAYQWAKEHPRSFYMQNTLKDPAVTTGTYGDFNANDEFFWAATALWRLTGKQVYLDDAKQYQPKQFTTPSWGNVASLGAFECLADANNPLRETMLQQLTTYCDEAVKDVETSSFQSPYGNSPRDFGWGCLAEHCCCQALALLYADKMMGTEKYRRYALQNADYLLGRNATGYCYVTGFGDKSPMHPHHRPSAADAIEAPFPGMLVGGPNPGQQDKRELKTAVYPSNVPDESYLDDTDSYASNEIAINWNASLVAFLCWLDAQAEPVQQRAMRVRQNVPLDSIRLSDPAILADQKTKMYYMTGTGGMMWRSSDLKLWEGPHRVTSFSNNSWMGPRPMIWAAELHQTGDGWYYYFATFTNQAVKIDTVRGNVIERRASQVLRADNPMGPYRAFGDDTYLPANRPTLDGTYWKDRDGKPYMVFCGEWLQNWNGTIEKIELKPDLSGTVGEPKVLFRASDSPWSRERNDQGEITWNKVTDGPYLFRTGTGRLGMVWTSWVFDVYTQGVAYSESGTLDGPWIQEPQPITPPGYGHSMLFQRFDGQWMMSVHHHSKDALGRTVRIPHLFEVDLSGDKLIIKQ